MSSNATQRQIENQRILAKIKDPLVRTVMEHNLNGECHPKEIPHLYFPRPKLRKVRVKSKPVILAEKEEAIRKQVQKVEDLRHRLAACGQLPEPRIRP